MKKRKKKWPLMTRAILRMAHPGAWGGAENLDPVDASRFELIFIIYDRLITYSPRGLLCVNEKSSVGVWLLRS